MLTLFCRRGGRIVEEAFTPGQPQPSGVFWIDLLEPSAAETEAVRSMAGIDVPTPEEMREIEPSSRLYRDGLAVFMTASVLNQTESPHPETRAITFVLANGFVTTIRYCSPMPFKTFRARITGHPEFCTSSEMTLVELLDAIVDRAADTLETVDQNVGTLSKVIFAPVGTAATRDYSHELNTIGISAVRCSKVDESLVSLLRMLTFFDANLRLGGNKEARGRLKDVQRDIVALIGYVERQSEKLQLLLDATLGMINIQQNNIIKIFSVIAVVFLPPTLVASIYGMNFDLMPELKWHLGYPLALILMLLSAILPFTYFKHRGWL
ncbi:MAG: magnesium/cobalt transporter CorA [Rhodospirillales bacterium]